jgi:hypothetical protein
MNRRHSMKIIEDTVDRVDAARPRTDPAATDVPTRSRSLDLTRVVTTAELVVGAVVVARSCPVAPAPPRRS